MTIPPLNGGLPINIVPSHVFKHVTKMILLKLKKKVNMHNIIQSSSLCLSLVGRSFCIFTSLPAIPQCFHFCLFDFTGCLQCFLLVVYFSVNSFNSLKHLLLNKDGIKSHNPLEKYFSMQSVKGGADKNPTEKFN